MKKLVISESELTKLIQKAVETKLNEDIESDFSVEPNVPKTPTEDRLEDVFGKYSGEVPADVVRYMRKNPKLIITRLLDIYGQKMVNYMVDSLSSQIEDDVENLAEGSADENNDGVISPDELYRHFDLDGDGVVTMADYALTLIFIVRILTYFKEQENLKNTFQKWNKTVDLSFSSSHHQKL
jgi:hypothetical protein